jgi:glucose/arabinose dehydrogenase
LNIETRTYNPASLGFPAVIAPSQLQLVRKDSDFFKYWPNDLLISTLKDKSIRRLRLSENSTKVVYDEKIYIGERIRDIEPLDKGFIISTDNGLLAYLSVSSSSVGGGPFPSTNN